MLLPFTILTVVAGADDDWLVTRSQVNSTVIYNSTTHTLTIGNSLLERYMSMVICT